MHYLMLIRKEVDKYTLPCTLKGKTHQAYAVLEAFFLQRLCHGLFWHHMKGSLLKQS